MRKFRQSEFMEYWMIATFSTHHAGINLYPIPLFELSGSFNEHIPVARVRELDIDKDLVTCLIMQSQWQALSIVRIHPVDVDVHCDRRSAFFPCS